MSFKKIIRKLHLWLGLPSALIVLFLGITGCILAFQKEIEFAVQDYRFVEAQDRPFLPPSKLKAIGAAQLPGKHLHAVLYEGRTDAAQVIFYAFAPKEYYYIVYVNPYDGTVLKVKDMDRDFFRQVILGHFYLWLPAHIGQPIVASATLVFVVLMITGLILWWPRNKAARRQRFRIKWNSAWRRRNFDLHGVLGFYMSFVAIVLAVTGLVWGFQWFARGLHALAGGKQSLVYSEPLSDTTQARLSVGTAAIDRVYDLMRQEYPAAERIEVHIPESAAAPVAANANADKDTYWKTDYRYFDQYTLKELPVDHIYGRLNEASAGDKLIKMNYDLHTGAIWGLPGKILMFFASLIAASLPITGALLWRGRQKKKKKPVPVQKAVPEATAV
ncbi:MAG TPA: PepSY-associated TM helix domain-containing protein [Chitinophagaceae bacterium]|nr:PepSY-associated TM helix domain-containing protein [Chitinophagaceae bacterium]